MSSMTKLITFNKLASSAKCSKATVRRVVQRGKLEEGERIGRNRTVKAENITAAVTVIKNESPRSGYRFSKKTKRNTNSLSRLAAWIELSDVKRDLLMQIAEKYDEKELLLILSL